MFGQKKPEKKKLGFWRENVEALAVAVVMALTVKMFALEAFQVPTESMEPTIVGRASGGDRLIVNKIVYQQRDPRRFEVVVFQYPHNTLFNYVKRAVGMPDEWVFLRNGDIYTAKGSLPHDEALAQAKITRKPEHVQEALFDLNRIIPPAERGMDKFKNYWGKESGEGQFIPNRDEEWVSLKSESDETLFRFRRPKNSEAEADITNRRFDNWSAQGQPASFLTRLMGGPSPAVNDQPSPGYAEEVGDLRCQFDVQPESGQGVFVIEIRDGAHERPIRLELAVEGSGKKSRLLLGTEEFPITELIEVDEWTTVSLSNCDDHITVEVDGDRVIDRDYVHPLVPCERVVIAGGATLAPRESNPAEAFQPYRDLPHDNAILFGFRKGRAKVREIALSRDSYYAISGPTDFQVPPASYLMLGDNSPNSLDARGWKVSRIHYRNDDNELEVFAGDAEAVGEEDPAAWPQGLSRPGENPYQKNGETYFLDSFGNIRQIDPRRIEKSEIEYGHFVPRRNVVGRAYLGFWPILRMGPIH